MIVTPGKHHNMPRRMRLAQRYRISIATIAEVQTNNASIGCINVPNGTRVEEVLSEVQSHCIAETPPTPGWV